MPRPEQPGRPWPPWAHPAIVIVLITGCFHLYRGAPFDGVLFLGVGLALSVAETWAPAPVVPGRSTAGGRGALVVLALLTLMLTISPRYGDVDVLVVGVLGVTALTVAATRGDVVPPPRRGVAWPYAVAGLVAALNELASYFLQTSPVTNWDHPAFSDLMDPVFAWPPGRAVLVLLWLAAGWGLLRLMPARAAGQEPSPAEGAP